MSRVRKLLELEANERRRLAEAWILLLVFDLALRLLPFRRVQRLGCGARRPGRREVSSSNDEALAERTGRLVAAAANHHLYPMRCLPRSLTLQRLLRRQGVEAELRIGVRRQAGSLAAHAWLEQGGRPVSQRQAVETTYLPIESL